VRLDALISAVGHALTATCRVWTVGLMIGGPMFIDV
jgi:hypothetical protein